MKNWKAKTTCVLLAASVAAAGLSGCGKVDGNKTAITVNDEEMSLGQANFMLRYQQASVYNYYYQMYSMYGGQMPGNIFNQLGEDDKTMGENLRDDALESIEKEMLMRQHAGEYGVSLTDEEKKQAKEAAEAFVEKNGEGTMEKLYADTDDVQDALELYVIQKRMYDKMVADVDTEVSDDEAQQTTISYAEFSTEGTGTDEDGKTKDLSDKEKKERKEMAERFLELLKSSDDPATVSFADLKTQFNEKYNSDPSDETGDSESTASESTVSTSSASENAELSYLTTSTETFSTGSKAEDEDKSTLGEGVDEAVQGLADGEYYDGVVEGEKGYYVVRVDDAFNESRTTSKKESIVSDRKSKAYNDLLDQWIKDSKIKVASCWKKLEVKDTDMYTMITDTISSSSEDASSDSTVSGSDEAVSSDSAGSASGEE